jgi:hypothetical protein
LTSFSFVCANAAEADIATTIAKAEASALPPVRNTAFPINVKILACAAAGRSGPYPSSSRRKIRCCVDPGDPPFDARVRPGMRQSRGRVSEQPGDERSVMPPLRLCHCDKLDKRHAAPIENPIYRRGRHTAGT